MFNFPLFLYKLGKKAERTKIKVKYLKINCYCIVLSSPPHFFRCYFRQLVEHCHQRFHFPPNFVTPKIVRILTAPSASADTPHFYALLVLFSVACCCIVPATLLLSKFQLHSHRRNRSQPYSRTPKKKEKIRIKSFCTPESCER